MSILKRFGVHTPPSTFEVRKDSPVLLLDGDSLCYKVTADAKKMQTAINRFERGVLELLFLTKCSTARVHLTPKGCYKNGRHLLKGIKPYQGNRTGKPKPPLLEPLRQSLGSVFADHPDFSVHLNYAIEADDALIQDTHRLPNTLLVSEDKDLLVCHTPHYDLATGQIVRLDANDRFGWLTLTETNSGIKKLTGKGTKFFLAQCIMGDTADNVKGLLKLNGKNAGTVGAYNALQEFSDESTAVNWLLEQYAKIEQNVLPEAEALWLTRWEDDSALAYFQEHDLSAANKDYLHWCSAQEYYNVDEPEDNPEH